MIRPFTTRDLLRIAHLQPDGWQDIGPFFRFYVDAPICRAYKIEDKQEIVATGALILHAETAWLAHIIVAPDMRRRGLGVSMTRHLVDSAEKLGRTTQLLIATRMGEPLYKKLGFHTSCNYLFYHPDTLRDTAASSDLRRAELTDLPGILALDREASAEDRAGLVSGHTGNGLVYPGTAGNQIRGFYLPELGEGLIVARDAEAGQALMQRRLAEADAGPVLPAGNHAACQLLKDNGIAVKQTTARMVRNGDDMLRQDMLFNRIGGHLG